MAEWQTMKTAPRDGTWVLTWTNGLDGANDEFMAMKYNPDYGWLGGMYTNLHPTYWMPIQHPTKGESNDESDWRKT